MKKILYCLCIALVLISCDKESTDRVARNVVSASGDIAFEEIRVDGKPDVRAAMAKKAGRTSVPQIWIDELHVGGCDELFALERSGQLDPLLVD